MNVGILTYYDGLNHGAYLQALCLTEAVRSLGHTPEIIPYKNKAHHWMEDVEPWLSYRNPLRFLERIRKQRAFGRDHKRLPIQKRRTVDVDRVRHWEFDATITGSDVVWDTNIFGFDPMYFGELNSSRRIAYAASAGTYTLPATPQMRDGFSRFTHLSVRDENTFRLVHEATGARPRLVLDPVLLLEKLESLEAIRGDLPDVEPYALVYGKIVSRDEIEAVQALARQRKWKVISVGWSNPWADKNLLSVGPLEIFRWFRGASFVFSGTFHGTILALQARKPFIVRRDPAVQPKIISLLDLVDLSERGQRTYCNHPAIEQRIDYDGVERRLMEMRHQSWEFLRGALS